MMLALAALDPSAAAAFLRDVRLPAPELPAPTVARALDVLVRTEVQRAGGKLSGPVLAAVVAHWSVMSADAAELVLGVHPADAAGDRLLAQALARFPSHAGLLRMAAQRAAAARDAGAHDLLTRAARAEPTLATMSLVHRLRSALPAASGPKVRIALLSSYTIDALIPYLDVAVRGLGLVPEVHLAPFNSWTTEMLGADSGVRRFAPDIAFLSVSIDDLVPELAGAMQPDQLDAAREQAVGRVLAAVEGFFAWSEGVLVVHGMHSTYRDPAGILGGKSSVSRTRWLADVNAQLEQATAQYPRCYLLDMTDLLARRGGGALDNPKLRYLASMRLGEQVLGDVAGAYARYVAPLKGLARKCVVVDLDNTLWGGVVGEDGPHGIRLGHASPGAEYQDFQRYLQALMRRGVLLAIASKNNPDDALEVIRGHEEMILRETDFAAVRINWQPKPENVASLAEELNIGLDALVFVDDNPDERELMRQLLPQVLTVELPRDPARYRETLEALPQLQSLTVTSEDLARTASYRANREREQVKVSAASLDAYLASLGITVSIEEASDATIPRVHQLFQRTNQFNLTTRRYDAGQLAAFAADPNSRLLVARAGDRFGDHGLVAVALARLNGGACVIDSFLMSCRVIGYGVETALLADLCRRAREAGATSVVGEFIETRKNLPARDFYQRHGFTAGPADDGVVRWHRSLAESGPETPSFVAVSTGAA